MATFIAESRASAQLGGDPNPAKPAGAVAGDFVVGMVYNAAGGAITLPANNPGNPFVVQESSVAGLRLVAKFLDANDTPLTNYLFTVVAGNTAVNLVAFADVDPAAPFDGISVVQTTTGGNIVIPQITTTGVRYLFSMVQKMVNQVAQTFTEPGTTTERYDGSTVNGFGTAGGEEVGVAAGPTGSRTWDPSNATSGLVAGYLFALKDANTTFPKTLTATMDGTPALLRKVSKFLTGTMDGTPTLVRDLTAFRVLTATMNGASSIARKIGTTLTTVMGGVGSLSVKVGRTLTGVMDGTGSLSRKVGKTLTTVMDGTPDLFRQSTLSRTLEVVMDGQTTLTTRQSLFRTLTAVMGGESVLGSRNVFGRVLTAVMNGVGRGFVEFPWDSIPSDCPPDWSPNDGLKCVAGDVFFHEPPNQGNPVEGATVCLIRDEDGLRVECVLTDTEGHYSFPRDTNDPYTYHVEVTYDDGGIQQQGLSQGGCAPVVCT